MRNKKGVRLAAGLTPWLPCLGAGIALPRQLALSWRERSYGVRLDVIDQLGRQNMGCSSARAHKRAGELVAGLQPTEAKGAS
jgi:hypothetical protein